jgi:hypothetical protein
MAIEGERPDNNKRKYSSYAAGWLMCVQSEERRRRFIVVVLCWKPSKGNRASGLMADKWRRAWSINRSSSLLYVCHSTIFLSYLSLSLSPYYIPLVLFFFRFYQSVTLSLRCLNDGGRRRISYVHSPGITIARKSVARWLANFFTIKWAHWIERRGDEKFERFIPIHPAVLYISFFFRNVRPTSATVCFYY